MLSRQYFFLKIEKIMTTVGQRNIGKYVKYLGSGILCEAVYWDKGRNEPERSGFKISVIYFV